MVQAKLHRRTPTSGCNRIFQPNKSMISIQHTNSCTRSDRDFEITPPPIQTSGHIPKVGRRNVGSQSAICRTSLENDFSYFPSLGNYSPKVKKDEPNRTIECDFCWTNPKASFVIPSLLDEETQAKIHLAHEHAVMVAVNQIVMKMGLIQRGKRQS